MAAGKPEKKRGPKGGVKHQPGKGHDRKSAKEKRKRFARAAARKRRQQNENAKKAWEAWDKLSDDVKKLLGPSAQPDVPRPEE
jgi:hypothetical protein